MKLTTYTYIMMTLLTIIAALGLITFLLLLKLGSDQPDIINANQAYFFKIAAGVCTVTLAGCTFWWIRKPKN